MAEQCAAALFALAVLHTFVAARIGALAHRWPRHAGLLHLLGEVEVVFGLWSALLLLLMVAFEGSSRALGYLQSRQFTEPLFVFAIMVIAASRPVLSSATALTEGLARAMPVRRTTALVWLQFALVPLMGSLITEPAAMTIAALGLRALVFETALPARLKYLALGTLFVNVSIGGTLTAYAAPPVLMVSGAWQWDSVFMLQTFGWRAACAVLFNATVLTLILHGPLARLAASADSASGVPTARPPMPLGVQLVHLGFLAAVVVSAHHPEVFLPLFLFFLGFVQAYERHQSPLVLREALLVAFFLGGLVVLGGLQAWWLQPVLASLDPGALFAGALGLTAVTDNAALTYLGSLIDGLPETARYALVAGAVAGGGLTLIANAPNPAGAAILRAGFGPQGIAAGSLLVGAALPTVVAALAFLVP